MMKHKILIFFILFIVLTSTLEWLMVPKSTLYSIEIEPATKNSTTFNSILANHDKDSFHFFNNMKNKDIKDFYYLRYAVRLNNKAIFSKTCYDIVVTPTKSIRNNFFVRFKPAFNMVINHLDKAVFSTTIVVNARGMNMAKIEQMAKRVKIDVTWNIKPFIKTHRNVKNIDKVKFSVLR